MDIEELAFKDRKTLAQLNEKDLLDIIEFIQLDRKLWINQFSKTHNEKVDIRKENQELKEIIDKAKKYIEDYKSGENIITYGQYADELLQILEDKEV